MINPLEPKAWSYGEKSTDDSPETFRKVTRLSQHISYLKDFFRAYKDFTDAEIDTIEIMLMKLYHEGKIPLAEAVKNSGMSETEFLKRVKKDEEKT